MLEFGLVILIGLIGGIAVGIQSPLQGEDYQVWELDLPGENKVGFNCTEIGNKPTACWWNLNAG